MQSITTDTKPAGTRGKFNRKVQARKVTKSDKILTLLRRSKGATNTELCKATGWQAHSVRGFLSGTVKKRMGLAILSEQDTQGVRRYRLATTEDT